MEGIKENEPNTVELKITKSLTKQDVVNKILEEISDIEINPRIL